MESYKEIAERAMADGRAKRLSARQHTWKEGDVLIGLYWGRELLKSTKSKMPDYYRYTLETDEGKVTFLGSQSFDKMYGDDLIENVLYYFKYEGKQSISGGRSMHVFNVMEIPTDESDLPGIVPEG